MDYEHFAIILESEMQHGLDRSLRQTCPGNLLQDFKKELNQNQRDAGCLE